MRALFRGASGAHFSRGWSLGSMGVVGARRRDALGVGERRVESYDVAVAAERVLSARTRGASRRSAVEDGRRRGFGVPRWHAAVVGSKYAARDGGDEDEPEDKHASAGAGAGGVGKTTTETTTAAAAASVAETKPQPPPPPSPGAVASAHELAMEAAGLLSPSDGDPARALHLLRRAVAALEGER